ncbi:MAG: hypothetical protein ACJ8M1_02450 [Chthoniobacterales bacterium]
MSRSRFFFCLGLVVLSVTSCGPKDDTAKAEGEVKRFHKHWNQWEFADVYNEAHSAFRSIQPASKMIATLESSRKTLGELKSTKQRSSAVTHEHVEKQITFKYDSSFEHAARVETFSYLMTAGQPLLVNYYLLSPEEDAKHEAELARRRPRSPSPGAGRN